MKETRRPRVWLVALIVVAILGSFGAGILTGSGVKSVLAADEPTEFKIFWEAWDAVVDAFVDRDKIDYTAMTYGAIRGMLATLDDENHTVFFTPEEAEQQASSMEGSFEGIGAYVGVEDGFFRIITPMHGSPAEEAGIVAGDIVLKVDGEEITGWPEWEVISLIRGPAGTQVTLTILHPDQEEPVEIEVTRGQIEIESVLWAPIPGTNLVYFQITQFADDTAIEVRAALEEVNAHRPAFKGMVLDLRNNPGGYVHVLRSVASEFLDEGSVIMYERDADGDMLTHTTYGNGLARQIPIVAMINPGTASAGEILAAALQQNERAELVGETTTGTGTVLRPYTFSDGSVLRLGVTNWLTPDQSLLKDQGVAPDHAVDIDAETRMIDGYALEELDAAGVREIEDPQFNAALNLIKSKVSSGSTAAPPGK
jgi:carboxyl-terminal processing protease